MKERILNRILFSILLMVLIFSQCFSSHPLAARPIRLLVDGKDITSLASPIIENGRTLVPIRFVAEELEAEVEWNERDRRVTIKKDDNLISMKIDSKLVLYQQEERNCILVDVAPKIINDRTFVPLRLVSNIFGIGIQWNDASRIVYVDSSMESNKEAFFNMKISSLKSGQTIWGKTGLQIDFLDNDLLKAKEIKYLLLEPDTAEGFVIARGEGLRDRYTWIPDLKDSGEKVIVAAIYDEKGQFLAGDAILVQLNVIPEVTLAGIMDGEIVEGSLELGIDTSFIASRVKYEITNLDTGKKSLIGEDAPIDPYGYYRWEPQPKENGNYSIKAIAYDEDNGYYESKSTLISVAVKPKIGLTGVSQGQLINRPVNLLASRNFDVRSTEYILRDLQSGKEERLAKIPFGSYSWFPKPDLTGKGEVFVRVEDLNGIFHDSEPVRIDLAGKPLVILEGIGPNQVLRDRTKLNIKSNVELDTVDYLMINQENGASKYIAKNTDPSQEPNYTPAQEDIGHWNIKAVGRYNGMEVSSESIPIRVYLGTTYKTVPIIEKDKYLTLASNLAKESWQKTGMSAALQTAQSILETGWGQSVPVDKYSGQQSYNLFGIKGKGPAGGVIYDTWEVYNGKTYYVDAEFRAYNDVKESWEDHKKFLLNSVRYEPFKEVMHDSTQGAWALKRTGYATDPEYALKLMRIINQYGLKKLDSIGI